MSSGFIAIGDIHGCSLTLQALLTQLKPFEDRTFVFLGDYIDRGPNSKDAVSTLIAFAATHKCVFLRGNHEQMLLDVQNGEPNANWIANGGKMTVQSYLNDAKRFELPYQHTHFFRNTKLFYEADSFLFVHAGIDPDLSVEENIADEAYHEDFMWERRHLKEQNVWEKTVVFGHTPKPNPIQTSTMLGIDTGCVYKNLPGLGKLTAVILPEMTFVQQNCLDEPKPY
ncbi:serine/threonine protein phosphatase [bacterium]|nr:MAG: serine/threonine protein phosphatase [bacterium]